MAQCLEVDVASQGESEEDALENLREALELHFDSPGTTDAPRVRALEVEVGPLRPLPYREVKRKLEAAGYAEVGQKGATSSSPGKQTQGQRSCRVTGRSRWARKAPHIIPAEATHACSRTAHLR